MQNFKLLLLLIISTFLTYCGGQSDTELFDNAQKLLVEKKYDEALILFEELARENKNSELAPKALFESAKLYQGQVLKNLGAKESLVKSVKVFRLSSR